MAVKSRLSDIRLTAALILAVLGTSCSAEDKSTTLNPALIKTHQSITQSYETVPHLTAEDVINLDKDNYINQSEAALSPARMKHMDDKYGAYATKCI